MAALTLLTNEDTAPPTPFPAGDGVLPAKLGPHDALVSVIERPRLYEALSRGVRGPLTLVSSPAGTGKTTLVRSWVDVGGAPGHLAWVTLDDADARSGVFWTYVRAALGRSGVEALPVVRSARSGQVSRTFLGELAGYLARHRQPVTLVLDNAESLVDHAVWTDLAFLITHAGPALRTVVSTRVEPPMPMQRYRIDADLVELRFADLAFTSTEAGALIEQHGVSLSLHSVDALTRRTGGWAAALRLVGRSLERQLCAETFTDELTGGQDAIAAYFAEEVLDKQSAQMRDLLLRSSVAERLWPDLVETLTGDVDSSQVLSALAHANMFREPFAEADHGFSYHPMFHGLLAARLRHELPREVPRLRRRAARWFGQTGRTGDAVRQWAMVGDWQRASSLVVEQMAVARLLDGSADGLVRHFDRMPSDLPGRAAAIVAAAMALHRHDLDGAEKHLARADELLEEVRSGQSDVTALQRAALALVHACGTGDVERGLAIVGEAQSMLAKVTTTGRDVPAELVALIHDGEGSLRLVGGDLDAASDALGAAMAAAEGAAPASWMRAASMRALVDARRGQLGQASRLAEAVIARADRDRSRTARRPAAALVALAWVAFGRYDLAVASRHCSEARSLPPGVDDASWADACTVVEARLRLAQGRSAEAISLLRAASPIVADGLAITEQARDSLLTGHPDATVDALEPMREKAAAEALVLLGRARLARGEVSRAGELAAAVLRDRRLSLFAGVEARLLECACALRRRQPQRASAALDRALCLARPELLRQPFIEADAPVRDLLQSDPARLAAHGWLGLTETSGRRSKPPTVREWAGADVVVVEKLSVKEHEVLGHLAELLTTEEIAEQMFVSVNTVKSHVRSVLRKLSATRRNEAIRRARQLGVI